MRRLHSGEWGRERVIEREVSNNEKRPPQSPHSAP
jgi:hypothetical protein